MSRYPATQHGRVGRPWREVSARVYAEESYCWICGRLIDQRLRNHPAARSVDHLVQLRHGGDPIKRAGLRLACVGCNSSRSARIQNVPRERCACGIGLPCARLMPSKRRGYVAADPSEL